MKRSKLFLGITTGILAVVGVAAAKNYSHTRSLWYITVAGKCAPILVPCTLSGPLTCVATYTDGSSNHNSINGVTFTKGKLTGGQPTAANGIDNCNPGSLNHYLNQ